MFSDSSDDGAVIARAQSSSLDLSDSADDPLRLLSSDSDENAIFRAILESSESSGDDVDRDNLEQLRRVRFKRTTDAYFYGGNFLMSIQNQHDDESKNWASLPQHEHDRRWMTEFRMTEPAFQELLELVEPFLEPTRPANPNMRAYLVKEKLLVTINFLAHCHTLRQMAEKWGMPHNSISHICLHPTVRVLRRIFLVAPATKNINWPKQEHEQKAVMAGFKDKYKLPGCLGTIDGSLIPQRKPTKKQANQDTDSYYGYKGGIASLLLAVCDADMRLLYASAGAPACVGDAGLFSRTQLKENIDDGMMRTVSVPLFFEDGTRQDIWPFLVGDAAFPLGTHMMKVIEPGPPAGTPEAQCNRRLLNCRRLIEQTFGLLKGRWVFCKRNTFWNDVAFTRMAIEACCGLHNFLQERGIGMPDEDDVVDAMAPLPHEEAPEAGVGADVRELLVQWVREH